MRFLRTAGAVIGAMAVTTALSADTVGGRPGLQGGEIGLTHGDGFTLTAEEVTTGGAVVDTYSSKSGTIKVIGRRGSSVSIVESTDPATGRRAASVRLSTSRPKTLTDADAYRRSGRSTVADLVALGMPRDQAVREFGDMDTIDGRVPSRAGLDGRMVASVSGAPPVTQLAPTVSGTTPYDTLCASLSYDGGKISGYGCSTLYLVAASGGDWWFDNKYKFSAHSSDGSIIRPQRLFEVGWSLAWATNNIVYDWEPESTINRSECGSVRFSLLAKGVTVSIDAPICPTKIGPWNLGSTRSGSLWQGVERGQAYEAAIGVQAVHSPPNAAASYNSPFKLVWGPIPP
jgi:hypothetical protein